MIRKNSKKNNINKRLLNKKVSLRNNRNNKKKSKTNKFQKKKSLKTIKGGKLPDEKFLVEYIIQIIEKNL